MTITPRPLSSYSLLLVLLVLAALVAGCSSSPKQTAGRSSGGGGYYMDDGPGSNIPKDIQNIPDAVPRIEPHNAANFRAYTVMGQRFQPIGPNTRLNQKGVASWYGRKFHGKKTANGETYDMYAMTAAHPTLPLPSYAKVTHAQSGRTVVVRVNDRGPFLRGRVIDLSYAAAARLGIIGKGSDVVRVEAITHADIRKGVSVATTPAPKATSAKVVQAPPPAPTIAVAPVAIAPANNALAAPGTAATATPDALAVLDAPAQNTPEARNPAPTVLDGPSEGIYLQFGAFASYMSADLLTNRLNNEIAQVETRNVHIDSGAELHRVRLGPYPSRTAAVNAAMRIQEATGMQPALAQR